MSLLHCLAAYTRGHVTGVQAAQRDWSPFLTHFTTWSAMKGLRAAVREKRSAEEVSRLFEEADADSWATSRKILASGKLLAHSPSEKDGLPGCVCLSECTLPGLMSHCERYGRFGFVFAKRTVFEVGGRPCLYVGRDEYGHLASQGREKPVTTPEGRLFALSNLYEPPRSGARVQDYTHEREWRLFGDLELSRVRPEAMVAPARFAREVQLFAGSVPVIPLDTLFEWGA
jgi:hypothetical protein